MPRRIEGSHWYLGHLDGPAIPTYREDTEADREASRRLAGELRQFIYRTALSRGWSLKEAELRLHSGALQ